MSNLIKKLLLFFISKWVWKKGPKGAVYLTFDDGPHPERTKLILNILKQKGVVATFFMTGEEMDRRPDIVQDVISNGHNIGYHSYEHKNLNEMDKGEIINDLRIIKELASKFGTDIHLYRPPYGELSVGRILWCMLNGIKIVLWSIDSNDSFVDTPEEIMNTINEAIVAEGDILLLHDDTGVTVEVLPALINLLETRGHRFGALI